MIIGFDLAQASSTRAGCGWYAHALLKSMSELSPANEFIGYRNFAHWMNSPNTLAPMPTARVLDPEQGFSAAEINAQWGRAMATGVFPGGPLIVHSTSFQAPRLKGARLVVTIFDMSFWAFPEFTTDRIRLDCQKGVLDALEHADGLIFISDHARQEFNRFIPEYRRKREIKITTIPLSSRWPAMQYPVQSERGYWLFVGSQEPRKNFAGLLDAYEIYANKRSDPRPLWLAGGAGWKNDAWQPRLDALERRNLVRRLGYVPDEALPALYQNALALIFPSWYEGFGLPALEAMSQACPVICTDRSSLPEVAGEAPLYIDPSRPHEIAAAMCRIEDEQGLYDALARSGLLRARRFSWERTALDTLDFYAAVLQSTPN